MKRGLITAAARTEAREKFELGGLVVKAGFHREQQVLILGALIDLRLRLVDNEDERQRLLEIGVAALGDHHG